MMAGGAPLNIKMSLAARWDRRTDILQLKAASSLSWTIMRESAAGIRKSHSCLIRIQCPDLLIAILVFTFYFQKLHIPPVACNKKRVAKSLASDWMKLDKYLTLIRLNSSLMACIHDKKLIMISTRSLWELWGFPAASGWLRLWELSVPPDCAVTLNLNQTLSSQIRGGHPPPQSWFTTCTLKSIRFVTVTSRQKIELRRITINDILIRIWLQ